MYPMNDKPYSHTGRYGTTISCDRCDFKTPVTVASEFVGAGGTSEDWQKVTADVAEAMAYHAIHIHPELNGFSGYDTIRYVYSNQ